MDTSTKKSTKVTKKSILDNDGEVFTTLDISRRRRKPNDYRDLRQNLFDYLD